MFTRFYYKLLASFIVIIALIALPIVIIIHTTIQEIGEKNIHSNLTTASKVFERFYQSKREAIADSTSVLMKTHPQIRAILGTFSSHGDDDLFGEPSSKEISKAELLDISERLYSSVESLPLFRKAQVFLITDQEGRILLNKNNRHQVGQNIGDDKLIKKALTSGKNENAWWPSDWPVLKEWKAIEENHPLTLYDVFITPLIFSQEGVKGLLVVGKELSQEDIIELKNVSKAEVVFFRDKKIYRQTNNFQFRNNHSNDENKTFFYNIIDGETFIVLEKKLLDSIGRVSAQYAVFRSLEKELAPYEYVQNLLTMIGIIVGILGIVLSLILGKNVDLAIAVLTKAVNEVQKGNLDFVATIKSRDEFFKLGEAVNQMARGLKDKVAITKIFKKYVDTKVADGILTNLEEEIYLGGEKKHAIVYFSDIANFTPLSESLTPEQTVDFLNQYLTVMSDIISKNEGIVDKFVGDAIMAFWEIDKIENAAELACKTALAQIEVLKDLRKKWGKGKNFETFDIRIGLHCGDVIMGNVGSQSRMNYTIIGDHVNTASRLEAINKSYHTHIIVSEDIYKKLNDHFITRELDLVRVKGKQQPLKIYQLIGFKDQELEEWIEPHLDKDQWQDSYEEYRMALNDYQIGLFQDSLERWLAYQKKYPQDLTANLFIGRCKFFIKNPPEKWEGVFIMEHK